MKTKTTFLILGSALIILATPLRAQISESESSVNVLAVQCSMSSGFSSGDFDDYSRRLAKTLALLSPAQQTRVFGYLPQPGAEMKGDAGNLQGDLPVTRGQSMAAQASGETGSSALDGLVAFVGGINDAVNGSSKPLSAPIYAGANLDAVVETPFANAATSAAASVSVTANPASGDLPLDTGIDATASAPAAAAANAPAPESKTGTWGDLVSWLKRAESAYNSGTLREFLQGTP